jgi:enamine deaminase RidA (YjgF/YER057c/UK114 family)
MVRVNQWISESTFFDLEMNLGRRSIMEADMAKASMPDIEIFSPPTLGKTRGQYSQIARVRAERIFSIADQLSANAARETIGASDFEAQCTQVFLNVRTAQDACRLGCENMCSSPPIL